MDFFEVIQKRCSVREYADTPIAKEDLEKIIDAGRRAPTARCEEPWDFVVLTDTTALREVAQMTDHGKFLANAAAGLIVACRDTKYYLEDGCAAVENMLLAAAALGIGSCWIAGDKKPYCSKILDYAGYPQGYKLICVIALGYAKNTVVPKEKRTLESVIHFEKF